MWGMETFLIATTQGEGSYWHRVGRGQRYSCTFCHVSSAAKDELAQYVESAEVEQSWFTPSGSSFPGSLLPWHMPPLSFAETFKGKDSPKPRKWRRTEKHSTISFIHILLEVYKCITDISKTSYPFYRRWISSEVFTTVSGRAHTKGLSQAFLTKSLTLDTWHRLWPASLSQALWGFVYALEIKAGDGQSKSVQERMCSREEKLPES